MKFQAVKKSIDKKSIGTRKGPSINVCNNMEAKETSNKKAKERFDIRRERENHSFETKLISRKLKAEAFERRKVVAERRVKKQEAKKEREVKSGTYQVIKPEKMRKLSRKAKYKIMKMSPEMIQEIARSKRIQ